MSCTCTLCVFSRFDVWRACARVSEQDNAFVMLPGKQTLNFYPFEGFDLAELKSSLRVEHTATYM